MIFIDCGITFMNYLRLSLTTVIFYWRMLSFWVHVELFEMKQFYSFMQRWSPRGHGLGLEASWRVLGLGLGSQVLGLGLGSQVLGLEPKVLGLGPETVLALLVFKQILCKVLRCSSASVNEHNMYGFCFRSVALQIHGKLSCRKPALVSCTTCWRKCSARQQH